MKRASIFLIKARSNFQCWQTAHQKDQPRHSYLCASGRRLRCACALDKGAECELGGRGRVNTRHCPSALMCSNLCCPDPFFLETSYRTSSFNRAKLQYPKLVARPPYLPRVRPCVSRRVSSSSSSSSSTCGGHTESGERREGARVSWEWRRFDPSGGVNVCGSTNQKNKFVVSGHVGRVSRPNPATCSFIEEGEDGWASA